MDNPERKAPMAPLKEAVLIAGPTASGKSALALHLARKSGGVIVNADSMQVYDVLRILTARPDEGQLAAAPHCLYGHVDPREAYSTGRWIRDVEALADGGMFEGRQAIFVGGTGLYFAALLDGLSTMPDVPLETREAWRARLANEGPERLHARLADVDPLAASRIGPSDGQRIVRALEVHDASGRPLSAWQSIAGRPLVERASARLLVIDPDRSILAQRISRRFDAMVGEGAMEEVRAFAALHVNPAMPAAKAIGVRDLLRAERGEIGLDQAMDLAKTATRQYAKRQSTWFRNQLGPEWTRLGLGEGTDAGFLR